MKAKLLMFIGLVLAGVGILSLGQSSPVYAAGERYVWTNQTTLEGSGGLYGTLGKSVLFTQQGTGTYRAVTRGGGGGFFGCDITWTLTVRADNTTATLATQSGPVTTCDAGITNGFDKNIKVENPNSGPPMDGQEVDYRTVNCSEYYEGGENTLRCEAIKKCIAVDNGRLGAIECLRAWNTCLINNPDGRQRCIDLVSAGNLTEAVKPGAGTTPPGEEEGQNKTTCAVPGIGWILCPLLDTAAKLTDGIYAFVSEFLTVQPLTTDPNSTIFTAWSIMRNFANVAFVIVFLIIIFSQVTSMGVSNYGIKRLLPRLIIAAILVNTSFWICAIAVDLSNIGGTSLNALFKAIGEGLTLPDPGGAATAGTIWQDLTVNLLAGTVLTGALLYVGLSALVPMLLICLITIATVCISLILRQAIIILLIVVSPLAFVAYLLPNTESMFTKWRKAFTVMLIMYPVVSLLFGAGALASRVLMGS